MPRRNLILANSEIYHVYNKSIAKEEVFLSKRNLNKAFEISCFYRIIQRIRLSKFNNLSREAKKSYLSFMKNSKPLVEIYAYAFMPNHFHFLLKQKEEGGITKFLSNFQNSFAKYYNLKNNRAGSLFKEQFQAKRIESDEEFIHVARYIHLNPVTLYLIEFEELANYPWTSYSDYILGNNSLVNTNILIKRFGSKEKLIKFTENQADYQRKLEDIKRLILE